MEGSRLRCSLGVRSVFGCAVRLERQLLGVTEVVGNLQKKILPIDMHGKILVAALCGLNNPRSVLAAPLLWVDATQNSSISPGQASFWSAFVFSGLPAWWTFSQFRVEESVGFVYKSQSENAASEDYLERHTDFTSDFQRVKGDTTGYRCPGLRH